MLNLRALMATNVQAGHISAWQVSYHSFIPQIFTEHLLYAVAFFSENSGLIYAGGRVGYLLLVV